MRRLIFNMSKYEVILSTIILVVFPNFLLTAPSHRVSPVKNEYRHLCDKLPAYCKIIIDESLSNNLDPYLIGAVIMHESWGGQQYLRGGDGEYGLMQVMPYNFPQHINTDYERFDAKNNIKYGTKHLRYCYDLRKSVKLALSCYNKGPYAVLQPRYVDAVRKQYHALK